MNTHSKKDIQKELEKVELQITQLLTRKAQLEKQLDRKELILPFCVKRYDTEILMQGGDELSSTLYANFHCALTKAGKKITPLNVTRLWSLYNIAKVYTKDKKYGTFSIAASIGRKWFVTVNWEGNTQVLTFRKDGQSKVQYVTLKYRFTLQDLIHCLDIMSR